MRAYSHLLPICLLLSWSAIAQDSVSPASALRRPAWNVGIAINGGAALMPTPPIPFGPSKYAYNVGTSIRLGRVVTHERGERWMRGTLEFGFALIPVNEYFLGGKEYYTGGTELACPRWNFTGQRKRLVPFAGVAGGMVFGPHNFPPGKTANANFTVALESGAHIFARRHRSFDVTTRLFHISNAGTGHYNPGVPLSLQLMLGYTWY